jgi:HAD superfamily hydrolase (TIGR01458 family)
VDVAGVLLDIDGVLTVSWEPLPGAAQAVAALRKDRLALRLVTNTTTHSRAALARTLRGIGIDVDPPEIVTAVVGTATYLRAHHPGARVYLLSDGDAREDMPDVNLVDEEGDVVVIGGACDAFTYEALNRGFRMIRNGAALVGMHRNLYWRTSEGLALDGGAFIAGLEQASGVEAVICGKPSPEFFDAALSAIGVPPERALMVGDDIENDVLGAQRMGISGVLVKTGKFAPADLERGRPDYTIDSVAALPSLLGSS